MLLYSHLIENLLTVDVDHYTLHACLPIIITTI